MDTALGRALEQGLDVAFDDSIKLFIGQQNRCWRLFEMEANDGDANSNDELASMTGTNPILFKYAISIEAVLT